MAQGNKMKSPVPLIALSLALGIGTVLLGSCEEEQRMQATKSDAPPLDRAAPAKFATATFALG